MNRLSSLIRIGFCSLNARMGAKPVSLRIKSASVNGVQQQMSARNNMGRFACMLCNRSLGDATVHEQKRMPTLKTKERFNSCMAYLAY